MKDKSATDELWGMHIGLPSVGMTQLIDLYQIPAKMQEIERKYRFPTDQKEVATAISALFAKVGSCVAKNKLNVTNLVTFVGIDQYYIYRIGKREFQFRYRSGANRPPQVTVKYRLTNNSNLARGEININVGNTHPDNVRAMMSVQAAMVNETPIMFSVQQSGTIWTIENPKTNQRVEIVVYHTKRFAPEPIMEGAFVEIEPLDCADVQTALTSIKQYELALGLGEMVCNQSIAEMFRPSK